MDAAEVIAYLSHLTIEGNVAPLTQTVALSALLFLYRQVLKINLLYIGDIETPLCVRLMGSFCTSILYR